MAIEQCESNFSYSREHPVKSLTTSSGITSKEDGTHMIVVSQIETQNAWKLMRKVTKDIAAAAGRDTRKAK